MDTFYTITLQRERRVLFFEFIGFILLEHIEMHRIEPLGKDRAFLFI